MCRRIIISLVMLSLSAALAGAQTSIPGGPVSGLWDLGGSPYLIEGEINIPTNDTLTIDPGVEVNFQGHYKFIVYGWLLAEGTVTDSILFTAENTITGWHGIRFINAPDNSHLSYSNVEYGQATGLEPDYNAGGIYCDYSSPVISHCTIRNCTAQVSGGGIGTAYSSNPQILNCLVESCSSYGGYGEGGGGLACGYDSSPVIDSCTFSGNSANNVGGGIGSAYGASPTISNCTLSGNTAEAGGALGLYQSSPVINNCGITGNSASGFGGGIYCEDGANPDISGCIISGNDAATEGGGIGCNVSSSPTLTDCSIDSNSAGTSGGGIMCDNLSNTTLQNCTIGWNSAGQFGGGIHCEVSSPTIENCMLSHNEADSSGGGINCYNNASPIISNCEILNNVAHVHGGGMQFYDNCNAVVSDCYVGGNSSDLSGGGIGSYNSSPQILNCIVVNNSAYDPEGGGGGIACGYGGTPLISGCTIEGNTAPNYLAGGIGFILSDATVENCNIVNNYAEYGGGVGIGICEPHFIKCRITDNQANLDGGGMEMLNYPTSPTVENCTVSRNEAPRYGSQIDLWNNVTAEIFNTVIEGATSNQLLNFLNSPGSSLDYNDVHNSVGSNFSGTPPAGFGILTGINANGDSCDVYMNIFEDPEFVYAEQNDYRLSWGSACIDAGDPTSPLDPDGTCCDIGAFCYDQSVPVRVLLTPHDAPIQVPAGGGTFDYTIHATNIDPGSHLATVWCEVTLPDGSIYGPVLGPLPVTLGSEETRSVDRTQTVPGGAPEGMYMYHAYAVAAGNLSTDSFSFVKLGADDMGGMGGWTNTGDWFEELAETDASIPLTYSLGQNYPNPFNPTTTIGFALPEVSKVHLAVYDVAGRLVATLVDGWRDAGNHQVTFDGTALSSGVYFYKFTAGEYEASGKMVLMK